MKKKETNAKNEIKDLSEIMQLVDSKGRRGAYATKWFADIKVIIDSRVSELNERISTLDT